MSDNKASATALDPVLPSSWSLLDDQVISHARALAMDAVEAAGNGHPGTAMSLAPAAYLLFQHHLRHDPADPSWPARDRFVLSAGHSSLTLYTELYLSGYGLTLDDLRQFRRWGSLTPGHPEHGHTSGVETTTGPLGQGLGNAVGMAMAARFERGLLEPEAQAGAGVFDHRVYVICSDGDLEEGVTSEVSSIAGLQKLGNLIAIWDDNTISIEGRTAVAFTEDVLARYGAYGWHTLSVDTLPDGSVDVAGLHAALLAAEAEVGRPTMIRLQTVIGWPAPNKKDTGKIHGSALGAAEVAATKVILGLDPEVSFAMPDDVLAHARAVATRGAAAHHAWQADFAAWSQVHPDRATLLQRMRERRLPDGWDAHLPVFEAGGKPMATRVAGGKAIEAIAVAVPEFWGGSADLAESNNTHIPGATSFLPTDAHTEAGQGAADPYGRVLHFGIREHAMGSIMNGIALHGGTRVFGGTFLVFSDYMRPPVRLAALMKLPTIYVWTHDSIGLGEDGPTHQPVEHLSALRAIPGLSVLRPGDANETVAVWATALRRGSSPATAGPCALALSRQTLPVLHRAPVGSGPATGNGIDSPVADAAQAAFGGYVLTEATVDGVAAEPQVILIATGSELSMTLVARDQLQAGGVATRVVSMPCREWFDEQDLSYRQQVLPGSVRARVTVEAGIAMSWNDLLGDVGRAVSLEHFGASADFEVLYHEFGFTPERIVDQAQASLAATRQLPT